MDNQKIENINKIIDVGNSALINNDYIIALDKYNMVFQYEIDNVIALTNIMLTLLIMRKHNIYDNNYNIQEYMNNIKELNVMKKEQMKKYILNDLYDEAIFDKVMSCDSCIDFLCQFCHYSDDIIGLIFSYYKNINLDRVPLKNIILLEQDMISFTLYIKKHSKINLKVYSLDLHNYAKELLLRGHTYTFPFFKVALTLYDNNETQFYYYLSTLIVCLNNNSNSYFDKLLIFEQKNVCSIRNHLLEYRTILVNYVLNHILDESYKQKINNSIDFEDSLNSRINVIFCVLQFIDGYYLGMEEDCYKLIVLLKYFIRCKLYGFGEKDGRIQTFCNNEKEFEYLKNIYNNTLEKFGEQNKINRRDRIKYVNNIETNRILISDFEKDVDTMFSYANLSLANKFKNFSY